MVLMRGLDRAAADEKERVVHAEKMLADFEEQAGKPFDPEARLKELLALQAELNCGCRS